jgi:DNA-binding transcriptional regulator YiaG
MTIQLRNAQYRISEAAPLHYTACGLDDVYLVNGFTRETVDGEEYVTVADLDGLWKAIGMRIVTTKKTLAPKEIKFLRDHMDKTQAELGALLRVSDQTIARWEKGETKLVPGPADFMLRVLFLACPAAQPEGGEILQKLMEMCDNIIESDDSVERPILFKHSEHRRRWKQAGQLQAACM